MVHSPRTSNIAVSSFAAFNQPLPAACHALSRADALSGILPGVSEKLKRSRKDLAGENEAVEVSIQIGRILPTESRGHT